MEEKIDKVALLDSGELFLGLRSRGKDDYQYVYRAGKDVYWCHNLKGFKSSYAPNENTSPVEWYNHIISIVSSELGVTLILGKSVSWQKIDQVSKQQIINQAN